MPEPEALPAVSSNKRLLSGAGVFAIFTVIGPAAAGTFAFVLACAAVLAFGYDPEAAIAGTPLPQAMGEMAMLFLAAAYAFGGVQAALTGLWAGIATWRHGDFSRWTTVLAAVAATLIWIGIVYSPIDPLDAGDTLASAKVWRGALIALALLPVSIVCALFCRSLSRKLGLIPGA